MTDLPENTGGTFCLSDGERMAKIEDELICPLCFQPVKIFDVWSGYPGRNIVIIQCEKDRLSLSRPYYYETESRVVVRDIVRQNWLTLCHPAPPLDVK